MGHKVNPIAYRIGITQGWKSKWFSNWKNYPRILQEDQVIRKLIAKRLQEGGVARIDIERTGADGTVEVIIHVSRPGVVIGRGGARSEELKKEVEKVIDKRSKLRLTIKEVSKPGLQAAVLLHTAITEIEKRALFRRTMKHIIDQAMKAGAKGVKITMSGRLNGVEIARRETLTRGEMPLHTIRADIDYSRGTAHTTYGAIGIKVWVYKGEVFERTPEN
jgi:small subunit ribosomal protein S3